MFDMVVYSLLLLNIHLLTLKLSPVLLLNVCVPVSLDVAYSLFQLYVPLGL